MTKQQAERIVTQLLDFSIYAHVIDTDSRELQRDWPEQDWDQHNCFAVAIYDEPPLSLLPIVNLANSFGPVH